MELKLLLATPHYIVERVKLEMARQLCPTLSGHVVDIGCGFSPYRPLLTGVTQYTAVEAELKYRPSLVALAHQLPLADCSVDSVMLTEVIEHLREPEAALREAWRVLRPGGRLYLTAPMTWGLHYVPHDYYRFTNYGLSHLLNKTGFAIDKTEPMGGLAMIVFARLADCLSTSCLERPLTYLGVNRGRLRLCALPLVPFNLVGYYLSRLLDRWSTMDVFGWAVLAHKS